MPDALRWRISSTHLAACAAIVHARPAEAEFGAAKARPAGIQEVRGSAASVLGDRKTCELSPYCHKKKRDGDLSASHRSHKSPRKTTAGWPRLL